MNVNSYLHFTAQLAFVILSAVALYDYVQHRDPRRRDFALLCASLGLPLGITLLKDLFGYRSPVTDLLGAFALFSQPYFLFRLLQYFRPNRRRIAWAILLGMVSCWVILFRYIAQYPATTQMVIFGYCVVADGYCTWQYSQAMVNTTGALRRRLSLITISSGLFTIAVAGNVLKPMLPNLAKDISAVGLAVTAISAVLYYIAFIPPRWLRHAWQFEEMRDFLNGTILQPDHDVSIVEVYQHLCLASSRSVNGMANAVVGRDRALGQWTLIASTNAGLLEESFRLGQSLIEQACDERRPLSIDVPTLPKGEERRQLMAIGARTWLLVPILAPEHVQAVLLVLLRDRSLFIADDLALLELFAQQCTVLLENIRVTERKEAEKHLQVLNQLSEAVNRAEAVEQIYEIALSGLERLLQLQRASILIYDDQGILQRKAWRGLSETYRAVSDKQLSQMPDEPEHSPRLINNVAEVEIGPHKQVLLDEGVQAIGMVPLVEQNQLLGQFILYYDQPHQFTESEVQWVQTIARHVAYAIQRMQAETKLESHARALEEREIALRELNRTLEQRVQQRTIELERSNHELDQFAAVASHDLKAPLRGMKQLITWIAEDANEYLPAPSQAHLAKLQGRVQRMEKLLNDLLDYARVGRERHSAAWVNIGALVVDVTEMLAPPTGFIVKVCGETPIMYTERVPLETVFRNLIGNAIKHHHHPAEGYVEICALTQQEFVEFTIKDNGPGIASEFHQRIFEIFQTLKPRDQVEGSGMGLAVVKKSIELQGGTIQVESVVGNGTCFRFTWPNQTASAKAYWLDGAYSITKVP
jgi:signal transduction histidine kinase